jgi:hypothetical protein
MLKIIYKVTSYLLIIAIITIITGCTVINKDSNSQNTVKYTINEEIYTEEAENKYIEIKYPDISEFDNNTIQQLINEQVKNKAFEVLEDFSSLDDMDIRTTYSIELLNSKILSIIYTASSFHSSQAYPLTRTNTLNIEVDTGKIMTFNDILKVDESFISIFLEKFKNISEYNSVEDEERVNKYIAEMISYDLFINSVEGSFPEISVYLTEDSLVISIAVPYSVGSFVLYSAEYSDITEYLNIDIN